MEIRDGMVLHEIRAGKLAEVAFKGSVGGEIR